MKVKDTTLTSTEIARLVGLVGHSLNEWREVKANESAYEGYSTMIDSQVVVLSVLLAKLEGQLANS